MTLQIEISQNEAAAAMKAASMGAAILRNLAKVKTKINIVLATGKSQISMLNQLTGAPDIPWNRINVFHLDEYIGISGNHPASFRRYLMDHFVNKVPNLLSFNEINGDADEYQEEILRLNELISNYPVDLCFAGIGENGHLAFNDPPADFSVVTPYINVTLDSECRMQQYNEGWFDNVADVPTHAISMSISQIMSSQHLIVTVPNSRKAQAVKNTLESKVSPRVPASILQQHSDCHLYLDLDSSRLLNKT